MTRFLTYIARLTRIFHPRGTDRILTLLHHPDRRQGFSIKTTSPCNGFKLYADTASYIEWQVFFKGGYEPFITDLIRKHIGPDSVSVDVGANVGVHTLTMSRGKQVYAFEPEPRMAERLRANIELNGLKNVEVFETALSDKEGTATFHVSDDQADSNQGQASLIPRDFVGRTKETMVKVSTMDNLFGHLDSLDLIKIDTEGNDMKVLLGGEETIKRFRPVIIFEWHKPSWKIAGNDLEEAQRFFRKLEYSLFDIDKDEPLSYFLPDFANILAMPSKG